MATYAQLQAEAYWSRELVPAQIERVGKALRDRYGLPAAAIGVKGNDAHLSGGHRSAEWCRRSRYSTRGAGDGSLLMSTGQTMPAGHPRERDLTALDVTLGSTARMVEVCKRLDAALRANQLPMIRRFWGNVDGDQVVDGFDNLYDRATTSDSSHLWHLHLEWYRDQTTADVGPLIAVILGTRTDEEDDEMGQWDDLAREMGVTNAPRETWLRIVQGGSDPTRPVFTQNLSALGRKLDTLVAEAAADKARDAGLLAAVDALGAAIRAGGGNVETASIVAAVNAAADGVRGQVLAAQAEAAELRQRLAAVLADDAPAGP